MAVSSKSSFMKFCSDCDSRLVQSHEDVAGPGVCPKCNPEKILSKMPSYAMNHSGKTKQCFKGCGAEIYWDEVFKSDSGKFIPIDSRTDEPHRCDGPTQSDSLYHPDETENAEPVPKEPENTEPVPKEPEEKVPLPASIMYDVSKIPKSLTDDDPIIREIIQGHKEESLALIHYEKLVASESEKIPLESLSDVLSENIIHGLKEYGFAGLLPFQEESVRAILKGENSIISAPTGSGKTEAFAIPILQKVSENTDVGVSALLVYPLNALIDDQVSKISELIQRCNLSDKVAVYSIHGGQSVQYKDMILSDASQKSLIIATNFDFINYHLILQDRKWNELFKGAKIMVMDEAHSYTSFHGSNVYHVLKRMKRYMGAVQFVGSSATLDNSKEFFSSMFDLPESSFTDIKSKFRRKQDMHMLFVMPRKFKQRTTMEMLSSICHRSDSVQLVFSNSHNDAEFLASNLQETNVGIRVQIHRGGLDQRDRKLCESQMKAGELDVLSCTPTMELGIDIGHVDVVISAFKNEFDSFIQRIGRAGRKGQRSYAICVFDPDDAACHYFARHIDEYLSQDHVISINKDNSIISERHKESIGVEDRAACESDKSLFFDFAGSVNLRGASDEIQIYYNSRKIGTRGVPVGYYQLHQKAIYHFNKQNYEVSSLIKSKNGARAYLAKSHERQKRTIPIVRTSIIQTSQAVRREINVRGRQISLRYGTISLDRTITGYMKGNYNETVEKYQMYDGASISGWRNFHWKSRHSAVGITLPPEFVSKHAFDSKSPIVSDPLVHTISHVLVNASKILTKAESGDIDVYYEKGVIYIYDNSSDGFNGCSKIIHDEFEKILDTGRLLVSDCDCPTDKSQGDEKNWGGCPKCTFITNYCQTKNKELSKNGAKEFFLAFGPD